MYGLLRLNISCLNTFERSISKCHFCGLCNTLSSKYGFGFRMLTNHDASFLSILSSAQSDEKIGKQKCIRLFRKNKFEPNNGLNFASAIALLMIKTKLYDNLYN